MEQLLEVTITKAIIRDILGRYSFDSFFYNLDINVRVEIMEEWTHLISKELLCKGMVEELYQPINVTGLSLHEAIERFDYYVNNME